ncbi:hypothetical protein [Leifsonia aquatica]|uniref:hypothetical protein n=1 Tax=Leifsonia aquatica TaxID=144185 RepID=UPI0037F15682
MSNKSVNLRRVEFAMLIDKGLPPTTAGARVGVSKSISVRWAALLRTSGFEEFTCRREAGKTYPFVLKYQAVRAFRAGHPEAAVLEAFRLRGASTLLRWRRAFENGGPAALGGTPEEAAAADLLTLPTMRVPDRKKHSDETREVFIEAVAAGRGYAAAAKLAGIPENTGWAWYQKIRSGESIFLAAVTEQRTYPSATKLAAAKAVVEDKRTRAEVLAEFGIRNNSTLTEWVTRYRRDG